VVLGTDLAVDNCGRVGGRCEASATGWSYRDAGCGADWSRGWTGWCTCPGDQMKRRRVRKRLLANTHNARTLHYPTLYTVHSTIHSLPLTLLVRGVGDAGNEEIIGWAAGLSERAGGAVGAARNTDSYIRIFKESERDQMVDEGKEDSRVEGGWGGDKA
jgi:hypothetical protein